MCTYTNMSMASCWPPQDYQAVGTILAGKRRRESNEDSLAMRTRIKKNIQIRAPSRSTYINDVSAVTTVLSL
jgi:hypothetical protein